MTVDAGVVRLTAPGESPVDVSPGDRVSFTGDGFVEGLALPADRWCCCSLIVVRHGGTGGQRSALSVGQAAC